MFTHHHIIFKESQQNLQLDPYKGPASVCNTILFVASFCFTIKKNFIITKNQVFYTLDMDRTCEKIKLNFGPKKVGARGHFSAFGAFHLKSRMVSTMVDPSPSSFCLSAWILFLLLKNAEKMHHAFLLAYYLKPSYFSEKNEIDLVVHPGTSFRHFSKSNFLKSPRWNIPHREIDEAGDHSVRY